MRANGLIERQIVSGEYHLREDPTVVELAAQTALPRRRRVTLRQIRCTASRLLPIAQLVCAVATTLAALLYVASFLR